MISNLVRSEFRFRRCPSSLEFSPQNIILSRNVAVIDIDSFFALKSLPERLKRDFDESKNIFFTC